MKQPARGQDPNPDMRCALTMCRASLKPRHSSERTKASASKWEKSQSVSKYGISEDAPCYADRPGDGGDALLR